MMKRLLVAALFGGVGLSGAMAADQNAAPSPKQPDGAQAGMPASASLRIPDTLMFSIDEYNDIQSRLSRGNEDSSSEGASMPEDVSLYLSTIVYYGPKDWTIWINGAPIGPNEDFRVFKVTEIAPSYVELLVPLSAQGMRPVRLGPNQTFVTKSGVVVEGQQK